METLKLKNLVVNKEIAIVGGGPGGLTLARLLQLKGAKVKVYERDSSQDARVQGAIVDLHYDSGLKVMAAAGLMDAFKANYMPGADRFRLVDSDLNILADEHQKPADENFGNPAFRPEIDRGALRNMLIAALMPDTVVWDCEFSEMEQVNDVWEIRFKNGTKAIADIVIGAEGYRSKIRSYVTPIKAMYSGATIIQGDIDFPEEVCPEIHELVNQANLVAMGIGKTIAVQPRGGNGLTFYAASLYPENWIKTSGINFNDSAAVFAYLEKYYEGWHPVLLSLFKACSQFMPRPLDYFPLDQHWDAQTNLTIIGDAAHLMPPSGEGVNTAMLDALDLSECLCSSEYPDTQSAFAAYEKKMRARAFLLGQEALEGIKDFASPSDESVQKFVQIFSQNK